MPDAARRLGALVRATTDHLMAFETYAAARSGVRTPHLLELREGEGRLRLLGLPHCHDPRSHLLHPVVSSFRSTRPTLVFVEGGRPAPQTAARDAIGAYGEAGLLVTLAHRAGVAARSLEPWRLDEAQRLWTRLPREAVKLFYVLRDLQTWHRGHRAVSIERHAAVLLDNLSRGGLTGPPRHVDELPGVVRAHLPPGTDWREVPAAWFDPARFDLPIWTNEAARLSSHARDAHAILLLGRALLAGERVLAVIGFTHTVMQAPVWRAWQPGLREFGGLTREP